MAKIGSGLFETLLFCAVILLTDAGLLRHTHLNLARQETADVCQTQGCIKAAEIVKARMDSSVNPCDDFYEFACGNWLKTQEVPEDKPNLLTFTRVTEEMNSKLKDLLEKDVASSDPSFVQMIKNFYHSCVNLDGIERSGVEPLKNVLKLLGGWPVVDGDNWNEAAFDWIDTFHMIRQLGFRKNMFTSLYVYSDYKNISRNVLYVEQVTTGIFRDTLLEGFTDKVTAAYFRLMIDAANKLGADAAQSEEELRKVLDFETTLANYSLPLEQRRNITLLYNKYTLQQLKEEIPEIDWVKYFNGLFDEPIDLDQILIVDSPSYLVNLAKLLKSSDKRVIANYMVWRVVFESLDRLSQEWRDLVQDFKAAQMGIKKEPPRWYKCMKEVSSKLQIALSAYYVRNYFQESSKRAADEMVQYIRREFVKLLEANDWMDPETKRKAIEKANAMETYIAYPMELLDDEILANYHKGLILTGDNYFDNMRKILKWEEDVEFAELKKPSTREDWRKHAYAAIVNAFYSFLENAIEFPAGILQDLFFSADRPNYMNFGGIGYTIGHEITHGFDDKGRQFDKDGNNVNWWDDTTDRLFKEKAQCIIDQYSNYTEMGHQVNGVNNQGENIADNGGLKEAYLAYQSWVKDHGPEPKLPGLSYNANQLFWISAADVWCAKYKPEAMKKMIKSGSHSPARFRVNGPMSNIPQFSEDFQCPPGSPMNPTKKCKVW